MLRIAITIFCLLHSIPVCAQNGIAIYISPGLRIGWDSKGVTTLGGKISVGMTSNSDLNYEDNFFYLNLTAGFKSPISGKTAALYDECNFLQLQLGGAPFENAFLLGGGIGAVKFRKKDRDPSWAVLATLSMGNLAFEEADFFISGTKVINTDFGVLGILPLPIYGYDLGFE
jgi:hypothetical protein